MAVVTGTIGATAALLKLAKMLKGIKYLSAAGKAMAAKKGAGLATSAAARQAVQGGGRMAAGNAFTNFVGRAGYTPAELALNTVPDLALSAIYAGQMPGDAGDKALAIASNVLVGQGLAGVGRAAVNTRAIRKAMDAGEKVGMAKAALPQTMETIGYGAGGLIGYPVGENLQAAKSYVAGQGYMSPTEKMFAEQDEEIRAQIIAAYQAGEASGARGRTILWPLIVFKGLKTSLDN